LITSSFFLEVISVSSNKEREVTSSKPEDLIHQQHDTFFRFGSFKQYVFAIIR
jgi:hypothetical protein